MAHQPTNTILITGGNGSLGSAIAVAITKSQPGKHHLVLTARSLTDAPTIQTSSTLSSLGASFEFQLLDLSSLENVRSFASTIIDKIARKELPPFAGGGIVHSAARSTYAKGGVTKDEWNDMYGVNVLAPILLEVSLLPVLDNALIVNVSSATHSLGVVNYFSDNKKGTEYVDGETLGLVESMKRYGSCKLLVLMAGYALQRHVNTKPESNIKIVGVDPGGMSGESRLGNTKHPVLQVIIAVLGLLRPVVKYLKKDAFNPPEVPAKAIAGLFETSADAAGDLGGSYFVLDDKMKSSPTSMDERKQDDVLEEICEDLKIKMGS